MDEYTGKMEFFYQGGRAEPKVVVTLSPHSDLVEAVEQFEGFLRAAGYSFDGHLDFVLEDTDAE